MKLSNKILRLVVLTIITPPRGFVTSHVFIGSFVCWLVGSFVREACCDSGTVKVQF